MSEIDAENLFASVFQRWSKGDIENFERDYAEDVVAYVDDQELFLEDLKLRTLFFHEQFEILESKIEDFIYQNKILAVRLHIKLKQRESEEILEDFFYWIYEIKEKRVTKYWAFTDPFFGFAQSKYN